MLIMAKTRRTTSRYKRTARRNDLQLTRWVGKQWNALEPHHQQRFISVCLLVLSLLLFGSLTVFQTTPILSGINHIFLALFGWSAYLLVFGLVLLAVVRLIESIRQQQLVHSSLVIGLIFIWLLLLMESALIVGSENVGVLGALLVLPFLGWSRGVDHVIVLGMLLITSIVTFRLTSRHVLLVVDSFKQILAPLFMREEAVQTETSGLRPQYSRYSAVMPPSEENQDDDEEFEIPPGWGQPYHEQEIAIVLPPIEMEPLASNPRQTKQPETAQWKLPGATLLNSPLITQLQTDADDPASLAKVIQSTLRSLRVEAEVRASDISIGPTVIRFGIRPTGKPQMRKDDKTGKMAIVTDATGSIVYETRTRVSRILATQNDLALALSASAIRMEAPVPGKPYVGVEIPNKNSRIVTLREVLESKEYQVVQTKSKLAIGLGRDVAGQVRVGDLAKMPHLLIAGATGAGKSVCLNTIIASILMQATPDEVRLLMVDPKMVELNMYNGIPHLLAPVVTEMDQVVPLLQNAIAEMERRYRLFSQLGVRNLDGYRKMRQAKLAQNDNLPAMVIIIDELADLMMAAAEEVEGMICRLAQLARATGIHLVIATQRPSVDVITGLIKANIPTRISFMVSSAVDSRTILDAGGAERLLGRGDMLYLPADAGHPERIQGAFLSDDEAQALADYWRHQESTS
jgi:FtsK/SpoIIIE family/FtsK alpha domain